MKKLNILKQKGIISVVLLGFIGFLIITSGATAFFIVQNNKTAQEKQQLINNEQIDAKVQASKTEENDIVMDVINTNDNQEVNDEENKDDEEKQEPINYKIDQIDSAKGEITLDWYNEPLKVDNSELVDSIHNSVDVYKTGIITNGTYKDKVLYLVIDDAGLSSSQNRIIKDNSNTNKEVRLVVLKKYSDGYFYGNSKNLNFFINENITIKNLYPPEEISIPNSDIKLAIDKKDIMKLFSSYKEEPVALFKYNDEDYVYKSESYSNISYLVKSNDGTVRSYHFDVDFLGTKTKILVSYGIPYILDITWLDGTKNTNEYVFSYSSMYDSQYYYNAKYINDMSELELVGASPSGENLYQLKDVNHKIKSSNKNSILQSLYNSFYPGYDSVLKKKKEKISFDEFLTTYPLLFWQNPFGNFLELKNADYQPMAEMAKPVIYLYPETETDVFVQVAPTGGFSFTEPVYNNGWKVKAQPNSQLYNYADGKTYPYLFWEGFGMDYQRPEKGFVVAKKDIKNFLEDKLSQLGLIEKEYDEFIEFWLPRMQQDNYYFVTFISQSQFDYLAPLNISPKPDTIIRVFMDYQGLSEYIEVEPQTITTPQRNGFTVVEWGGALHK